MAYIIIHVVIYEIEGWLDHHFTWKYIFSYQMYTTLIFQFFAIVPINNLLKTKYYLPMNSCSPDGWAVWGVVVFTRWWLLVDHCVLRNWDRILVRAVKGLISRAGMVSICPLLWQRDVKLQQTKPMNSWRKYKENLRDICLTGFEKFPLVNSIIDLVYLNIFQYYIITKSKILLNSKIRLENLIVKIVICLQTLLTCFYRFSYFLLRIYYMLCGWM